MLKMTDIRNSKIQQWPSGTSLDNHGSEKWATTCNVSWLSAYWVMSAWGDANRDELESTTSIDYSYSDTTHTLLVMLGRFKLNGIQCVFALGHQFWHQTWLYCPWGLFLSNFPTVWVAWIQMCCRCLSVFSRPVHRDRWLWFSCYGAEASSGNELTSLLFSIWFSSLTFLSSTWIIHLSSILSPMFPTAKEGSCQVIALMGGHASETKEESNRPAQGPQAAVWGYVTF